MGCSEMDCLIIKDIGLLATARGKGPQAGPDQGAIEKIPNAWIRCEASRIVAVGTGTPEIPQGARVLSAHGGLVTAGLVDAHTHLVFGGFRQHELDMKLHGVPYLQILAQGGGILSTVTATRAASLEALTAKARKALDEMLTLGTTTCEAKSGYGLDPQEEYKQLEAVKLLNAQGPVELESTFMGAHALPKEYAGRREEYIRLLCAEMIPQVAQRGLARFCDVFCEEGVFSPEESRQILEAGLAHGLLPKIHADEIVPIGGSQLAGALKAVSAEHLILCPPQGIEALKAGGTIACLLPATSLYLGATFAPARELVAAGVPVAMATDYNPGSCPCLNMQLVMNLGCLRYRLTPEEVLTAVTLNGAAAICRSGDLGSVEPGKQADLVIWDAPDLSYLCYRMGSNLAAAVVKKGRVVAVNHSDYGEIVT